MYVVTFKILNWFLDLLFPVRCIFCGLLSAKPGYVCKRCLRSIPMRKSFSCIGCNKGARFGQTCFTCSKGYLVDHLFVVCDYKDERVKKMIKLYKYQFIEKLYYPLYILMFKYLCWLSRGRKFYIFENNPLIIPVPLSKYRLNWRGFNQAELLAKELSDNTQFDFAKDLLVRDRSIPQADIDAREERLDNIKGQFRYVGSHLKGREIVLIDDVCTTGATINECAKVLKENGAGKIYALVVARG